MLPAVGPLDELETCSREYVGRSAVSIVVLPRLAYEARAIRCDLGLRSPGNAARTCSLDDGAPDAERSIAEHADPLTDGAGTFEAQAAQRGDRAADPVVLSVVGERRCAHRAAQDARSPAAAAAAAKPSIIAAFVEVALGARAAGSAHRFALIAVREERCDRRRSVARVARREQHAGDPVGHVVRDERRALGTWEHAPP